MSASNLDRRRFLGATATAALATVATPVVAPSAVSAAPARARATGSAATFRWLGTSGWRIDIGETTLLIDPYLSRFKTGLFEPPYTFA